MAIHGVETHGVDVRWVEIKLSILQYPETPVSNPDFAKEMNIDHKVYSRLVNSYEMEMMGLFL